MNALVTSSRTPFALDVIRKLSESGHAVYAADTYEAAPGSHSRYLAGHFVTPAPDRETLRYVDFVERTATDHSIDVVVPTFEEAFFLATAHERLSEVTTLYTGRFDQLARLHDKSSFQRLAQELGVRTPETVVAGSDAELEEAIEGFPRYFARAAFSRGGVSLLTNTGPLAGHVAVGDCHPTPASPWLVQPFVDGPMVCTYSTLHAGRVTAHCTYRAPRQWEHSTGIEFLSVDALPSLQMVERIGAALGYTGQLSFDFVDGPDGLSIIECNPRTTDGALLMPAGDLSAGLLEAERDLTVVEPGRRVQLDFAVFASMFMGGLREAPATIHDLLHVADAGRGWRDALPALYSLLALGRHERLSRREHEQLFVAMSDDLCWNGEPIAGMTEGDAAVLDELSGAPAEFAAGAGGYRRGMDERRDRPPDPEPGDRSQDESPHHALNNPVGEPDPTEWPDPYERREDPRDPPDPDGEPFGEEPHPASGSMSTSEPHPSEDPEAGEWEGPKRDKLDD